MESRKPLITPEVPQFEICQLFETSVSTLEFYSCSAL